MTGPWWSPSELVQLALDRTEDGTVDDWQVAAEVLAREVRRLQADIEAVVNR